MRSHTNSEMMTLTVETGLSGGLQASFVESFRIGRHSDCAVCLQDDVVSRNHAELFLDNGQWWIRDLKSANGVLVNGQRVELAPLIGHGRFQLGAEGPVFSFSIEPATGSASENGLQPKGASQTETDATAANDESIDLDHYKKHYFSDADGQTAGEHTLMVRRAFAAVQKKQRRFYFAVIGVVVALLIGTGVFAFIKHRQVNKQRQLAVEVFYSLRTLEIDLIKLRVEFEKMRSLEAKIQIDQVRTQKRKLEENYDRYVNSLDVYRRGLGEKEKLILRMARRFGECEINMPDGFVKEVSAFIEHWQSSQRLAKVIDKARRRGYIPQIVRAMAAQELPAQFFYLAVQESNLNHRAVGPPTRFGIAKGMWQFIPTTAEKYGLRIGPLKDEATVDPLDERHNFAKSTEAAARYLRDIYTTDAQASGLLVMASYNWGEHRVVDLVQSMPENPRSATSGN